MSKTITYDPNWQETYKLQVLTAAEAVKKIRPGQRVFIGTGTGEPLELVSALTKRATSRSVGIGVPSTGTWSGKNLA